MKQFVDQLLQYIDSGRFFKSPIKLLYILFGITAFVPVALPIMALCSSSFHERVFYLNSWTRIVCYVGVVLLLVYFLILGFFGFFYWCKRYHDFNSSIRVGDKIKAIPVLAYVVRSLGEWKGVYLFVSIMGSSVIVYLCALLSGGGSFSTFLSILFVGCLAIIVLGILLFLLSYLIILVAHTISEKLLIKAIVANNVSDLGDIHRAAMMPNVEELESTKNEMPIPLQTRTDEEGATNNASTTKEE